MSSIIMAGLNILGATLTFVYFAFIEGGLENCIAYENTVERTWYFLIRTGMILALVWFLGTKLFSPLIEKLKRGTNVSPESVLGDLVNVPAYMAGLSLVGWTAAALIFGMIPFFFDRLREGPWHFPGHSLAGIAFVGGPFTVVSVYLVLEKVMGKFIQDSFPVRYLSGIPSSFRISVRLKVVLVSLLIGTIPVSMVSFITLRQIYEIQAHRQDISSFISQMPLVIGFLMFVAISGALVLSLLVARSVSQPLRKAGSAMERISQGHLEVVIPVLSNDEIGVMIQGLNRMVEGLRERDFIRDTFGSYVSPEVVTRILQSPTGVNLGGELKEVAILVSDLRGFTVITANLKPEVVVKIVNLYLEKMVDVITSHGGIIDEFTGDGILAFFGVPNALPKSGDVAVRCALEMQNRMPELNKELTELMPDLKGSDGSGIKLEMGIAINQGKLVVGNIGSQKRKKYGAVGVPINLAFRMEKETTGGDVLITQPVYEQVRDIVKVETISDVSLKGIEDALTLYRVLSLNSQT